MNKKILLSAVALLLLVAGCSSEDNNSKETKVNITKDLKFTLSFSDYNEEKATEGTRATNIDVSKKEIIPMGNLFAEASMQLDTAKDISAKQTAKTRAISDGIYTIYAYQGSTLKGTLKGTVTSNVFTATSPNQEIGLTPGTYTFVCANEKVNTSGTTWTINRPDIETARIGIAENVVITPTPLKQTVAFDMKHVGCKVRVRITMEGYPCENVKATLASTSDIPQQATFDPATLTYSYGNTAAYTQNFSMPDAAPYYYTSNSSETYFFPGTRGADLKLTLNSGTAYKLPVAGRHATFPSLASMAMNEAYVLNLTLKYNYIYLYSDGTIGQFTDAAHATKTPIAMVVSRSKRLAVALKDATDNTALNWGPVNTQSNTTMSSTYADHQGDFNGEAYTWATTYSKDGIVKGNDQAHYPMFYAAAHYDPGVQITGANIGKWFLPTMGEWDLYEKNIVLGNGINFIVNDPTYSSLFKYNPEFYGFRRANGSTLPGAQTAGGTPGYAYYISASEASPTEYYVWGHYFWMSTWPDSHYFAVKIKKDYSLNRDYYSSISYPYTQRYVVRPFVKY